jgi:hypothetical protein
LDQTLCSKKLNNISSIYTAEIRAIIQAGVTHRHHPNPITIYSDSMSSLMTAQNRNTKETGAIKLANLLNSEKGKIKLVWTPWTPYGYAGYAGYAGIPGNELADSAAKLATNLPLDDTEAIAEIDLILYIQKQLIRKKRQKTSGITRKQQVAISRIKMGYTRQTHR